MKVITCRKEAAAYQHPSGAPNAALINGVVIKPFFHASRPLSLHATAEVNLKPGTVYIVYTGLVFDGLSPFDVMLRPVTTLYKKAGMLVERLDMSTETKGELLIYLTVRSDWIFDRLEPMFEMCWKQETSVDVVLDALRARLIAEQGQQTLEAPLPAPTLVPLQHLAQPSAPPAPAAALAPPAAPPAALDETLSRIFPATPAEDSNQEVARRAIEHAKKVLTAAGQLPETLTSAPPAALPVAGLEVVTGEDRAIPTGRQALPERRIGPPPGSCCCRSCGGSPADVGRSARRRMAR